MKSCYIQWLRKYLLKIFNWKVKGNSSSHINISCHRKVWTDYRKTRLVLAGISWIFCDSKGNLLSRKTIAGNEKLTWPIISRLFFRFVQHGGEKFSFWCAIWNGLQMSYEQRLWLEVERFVLKTRFHVKRRKNSAKITPVFFLPPKR